jgi:hypothetical protein
VEDLFGLVFGGFAVAVKESLRELLREVYVEVREGKAGSGVQNGVRNLHLRVYDVVEIFLSFFGTAMSTLHFSE